MMNELAIREERLTSSSTTKRRKGRNRWKMVPSMQTPDGVCKCISIEKLPVRAPLLLLGAPKMNDVFLLMKLPLPSAAATTTCTQRVVRSKQTPLDSCTRRTTLLQNGAVKIMSVGEPTAVAKKKANKKQGKTKA